MCKGREVNNVETFRARVSWNFFRELLPFNAEILKGNAMLIKACGAKPSDGSILRSKEYLLFGHGIATVLLQMGIAGRLENHGYVFEFSRKVDPRGVEYWNVQSVVDQMQEKKKWCLEVSYASPPDDEERIQRLIGIEGKPGQFMYLACLG